MIASKRFIDGLPPFIGRHFSCEARNSGRTARVPGFSFRLYLKGGLPNMKLNKPAVIKKLQERFRNVNAGRGLYTAFLVPTMLTMFSTRAFAADTIWTKASAIMQDVYTQILGISTIAAVVTAAIALLLMNFSRSGRTVDESRAWLKRIIITWAILNSHLFGPCQFYRRNWLYYDRRIQRHCRILWYFQHSLYRNLPGHQD